MDEPDPLLPDRQRVAHIPWLVTGIGMGVGSAAGSILLATHGPFPTPKPVNLFVIGAAVALGAGAWVTFVEARSDDSR